MRKYIDLLFKAYLKLLNHSMERLSVKKMAWPWLNIIDKNHLMGIKVFISKNVFLPHENESYHFNHS